MFLTQLIRIPSVGITMYLIKFTVIYEESTEAQSPVEYSVKGLPPLRVPALLSKKEILLPHRYWTPPSLSPSITELAHPQVGGPKSWFGCFQLFLYSVLKILNSMLKISLCSPLAGQLCSLKKKTGDLPGGPPVKNLHSRAGDMQVPSLVGNEDPTCPRTTKRVHHNC